MTLEKDYYERYWKHDLKSGAVFEAPPDEFNEKNIPILEPYLKGNILDLGCGEGRLVRRLSEYPHVTRTLGIDVSSEAIKLALQKNKTPKTEFAVTASNNLPCGKDCFDLVASTDVMEHLLDVECTLMEINRVLKKDGFLFITTTDFNFLKKLLIAVFKFDEYFYPTTPHIRFFTHKTLKAMLNKTGFKVVEYQWDGSYMGIMPKGQIVIAQKHG
jgi:2-polyprenyl-3-methyl-5-hydroxy-6-metoxy-1,4-benzoquinol methylase